MRTKPEPAPLTEAELDKIIQTIPGVNNRAKMISHLAVVRGWRQPKGPSAEDAIVSWIRETWTSDTVRAKMARKVAGLIEKKEYLPL